VNWYTTGKLKYIYSEMFYGSGHDPFYPVLPGRTANRLHTMLIWGGLLGMLLALRRWREPLILLAVVVAVMTGIRVLFVPEYRYNFTVMPLFIIFLTYVVITLGRRVISGRRAAAPR
jgi:hypothetical protein